MDIADPGTTVVSWAVTAWVCSKAEHLRLDDASCHRFSPVLPTSCGSGMGIVLGQALVGDLACCSVGVGRAEQNKESSQETA